jgi:hypothetical protein
VGIEESSLISALKRISSSQAGEAKELASTLIPPLSRRDPLEEYCLSLLIHHPELNYRAKELSIENYFERSENREILLAWLDSPDLASISNRLGMTLQENLENLITKALPPMSEAEEEQALNDCAYRLRERWLRNLKAKEGMLLSEPEEATDLVRLQQSCLEINAQLKEVFQQRQQ